MMGGKIMSKIIIEKTWTVDNKTFTDPLIITKSYLVLLTIVVDAH